MNPFQTPMQSQLQSQLQSQVVANSISKPRETAKLWMCKRYSLSKNVNLKIADRKTLDAKIRRKSTELSN